MVIKNLDKYNKEFINKGYSTEEKYKLSDEEHTYLLKISPLSMMAIKDLEIKYSEKIKSLGVNYTEMLEVKITKDNIKTIYTWIDGKDMNYYKGKLSESEYYSYGVTAGKYLRKIHSLVVEYKDDWEEKFNKKIDKKIEKFESCKAIYPEGEYFVKFINKHRNLLKFRPQSLCHGDYHVGNMMIDSRTRDLIIVDFGSLEIGDPYEEFNRMIWNVMFSKKFAIGLIEGYFKDTVIPNHFWKLVALYMSVDVLSSIPWAMDRDDSQIEIMINRANKVLKWFDNFNKEIPIFMTTK